MPMSPSDIQYWQATIRMCEMAMKERYEKWRRLKRRLGVDFGVAGVKDPIYVARFYKLLRETIASVAFRHPFIYVRAEEDPADPDGQEVLENSSPILQDFANDALEIMDTKPKVKQALLDAVFTFRGWLDFSYVPPSGILAPYVASDALKKDFPCVSYVRAEHVLVDPLVEPHDFSTSRFVIRKMFPSLDHMISDPRFKNFETQLRGLKHTSAGTKQRPFDPYDSEYERLSGDEKTLEVLKEAHRLAGTRCLYQVQDRIRQRLYHFADGIDQPIEDKEHPFLKQDVETEPDPITGRPLMARIREMVSGEAQEEGAPQKRREYLVKGGFTLMTMALDVADEFYGPSIMEYANPIQDAVVRIMTRKMTLLNRFKRHPIIQKVELENNPAIRETLTSGEDGEPLVLLNLDGIKPEVPWGNPPPGDDLLMQNLLGFEADTIRTTASATNPDTATETAVAASETEMNRLYSQDAVEGLYLDIVENVFSVMADDRFQPQDHTLKVASETGAEVTRLALKSWMLRGRWNVQTAAGSSNILYEAMNKDKVAWTVDRLRNSPNADQLKLDKYIIRAGLNIDPKTLLKDDANTDAAKAAELENQMILMQGHDPGVTPGEDHRTHMSLQNPNVLAQHPQMAQLQPEQQQMALRIGQAHYQAHQQALASEATGSGRPQPAATPGGNGTSGARPDDLIRLTQSNAQRTQDVVSKEAEERAGR